ncbi:hypothetical protein DPMN_035739 [Dreissena polymorpha]|uniref:Uncharacterized protein n=1 Tax=Dreissena polymorpha TaxID=45954 RepID=A0A9D4RN72_DREPO|nr:hypothetical protein DPMN_035739 [Dreissena polymorpha]
MVLEYPNRVTPDMTFYGKKGLRIPKQCNSRYDLLWVNGSRISKQCNLRYDLLGKKGLRTPKKCNSRYDLLWAKNWSRISKQSNSRNDILWGKMGIEYPNSVTPDTTWLGEKGP